MNCPSCRSHQLQPTFRSGLEIDYCPNCHGIWLDRGELDKLIEPEPESFFAPIPADQYDPDRVADEGQAIASVALDSGNDHRSKRSNDRKKDKKSSDKKSLDKESSDKKRKKQKKRKKKTWGHRLGEMLEELVDELD